jgi:acyl dehydratase
VTGDEVRLERTFTQADFDRFAALSGDNNPIHVNAAFSARSRFGRPVAHGLLLVSILRGLIERLVPGGRVVHQSIVFPAPTYAGEPMQFFASLANAQSDSVTVQLRVSRAACGTVTCEGQSRVTP